MALNFLPTDAAGFETHAAPAPRRVGAVAPKPETAQARRNRFAAFGDCMELSFAGLVMLAALLFAAGLARYAYGLNFGALADVLYGLAAAIGGAALAVFGRGLLHLRA